MKELIEKLENIRNLLNNSKSLVLENSNYELVNIGDFDEICNNLFEAIQALQQSEGKKEILIQFPDKSDFDFKNGREIKIWMKGYEKCLLDLTPSNE